MTYREQANLPDCSTRRPR